MDSHSKTITVKIILFRKYYNKFKNLFIKIIGKQLKYDVEIRPIYLIIDSREQLRCFKITYKM